MPYINRNIVNEDNKEQADDISTLMLHVGVMARAYYSLIGTTAFLETMANELPLHMKYNPKAKFLSRDNYSDEVWKQMLRTEIELKIFIESGADRIAHGVHRCLFGQQGNRIKSHTFSGTSAGCQGHQQILIRRNFCKHQSGSGIANIRLVVLFIQDIRNRHLTDLSKAENPYKSYMLGCSLRI